MPSRAAFASLRPGLRINHIPGIGSITSARITGRTSVERPDFSRFVLVTGVDPLRVYVHGEEPNASIDRIIAATIIEGRDAMTRAVRDLLVDRDACFELLRFDFARADDGSPRLLRCALSPAIMTEINDSYVRLPASWARMIVQGMNRWRVVPDAIANGEDVEERMQAFDDEGAIGRRGARWLRANRTSFAPGEWEHVFFVDDEHSR